MAAGREALLKAIVEIASANLSDEDRKRLAEIIDGMDVEALYDVLAQSRGWLTKEGLLSIDLTP